MIIGLTGSIATGKSTVSRMLKEKGYPIVDADEISRQVVEPGSSVLEKIADAFGKEIIDQDGRLNREKLGGLIFNDQLEREKLNAIMHPAVRQEMIRQKELWLEKGFNTVIMDIPLLFESKLQSYVEKIIVVSATPSIQRKRLMARNNLTGEEADARINSQLPIPEKEKGADAVINNNDTLEETERQLDAILAKWFVSP
ncbi:dephospho-CoA kinase [Sporosarcina thermotolerans]|uniref:Dephospho-CoA kinase n=1 Tax=Sporosarcina thermotolerans TaxID=633404 RepID=A0AAW9ABM5_9BACL|nr:dephospho-CoA kinase [Sporosarcina thermotolerans]MDW0118454.1 dephospho-CoA kinase [Sporosarcina thermotolerans]WHT47715.1 dephospho-CoA kinase [Sporosarcina thermotolerans]